MKFHISKQTKTILMVIVGLLIVLALIRRLSLKDNTQSINSIYDINGLDNIATSYATYEHFENSVKPKVILFYATWCGHCEQYLHSGVFEKASETQEVQGVIFEKLDADKNESLREKYDITGFPTIIGLNSKGDKMTFEGNRNSVQDLVVFAKSLLH